MQLDADYTQRNVRESKHQQSFCKRSRSQIEIDEEEKIDASRKIKNEEL